MSEASTKSQVDHTAILSKERGPNNQTVGELLYYCDSHVAHLVFRQENQQNLGGTNVLIGDPALFVGLAAHNTPFPRVLVIDPPPPCVLLDRTHECSSPFGSRVYELQIGCRHIILALGSWRWVQYICGNGMVQPEQEGLNMHNIFL